MIYEAFDSPREGNGSVSRTSITTLIGRTDVNSIPLLLSMCSPRVDSSLAVPSSIKTLLSFPPFFLIDITLDQSFDPRKLRYKISLFKWKSYWYFFFGTIIFFKNRVKWKYYFFKLNNCEYYNFSTVNFINKNFKHSFSFDYKSINNFKWPISNFKCFNLYF